MGWKSFVCGGTVLLGVGPLLPAADHPRDPWVFRSVLDKRARMLTAAFSDKLYVAYDTQDCFLHRAWAGKVKFTGGVYDARHGPQPQSEGPAYFRLQKDKADWTLTANGKDTSAKPHFLGYKVKGDDLSLSYTFQTDNGTITLIESPSFEIKDDQVTLIRSFAVTGLPDKAVLAMTSNGTKDDPEAKYEPQMPDAANFARTDSATTIRFDRNGTFVLRTTWKAQ